MDIGYYQGSLNIIVLIQFYLETLLFDGISIMFKHYRVSMDVFYMGDQFEYVGSMGGSCSREQRNWNLHWVEYLFSYCCDHQWVTGRDNVMWLKIVQNAISPYVASSFQATPARKGR